MTPRTFWDRNGWLWGEDPVFPEYLRPLWSPETGSWYWLDWTTATAYRDNVERSHGPLVASC